MRKLVVIEFLSLDGVMQAPGAPDEEPSGGFQHGGWAVPYFDDELGAAAAEGMAGTDAYLFGRKTYQSMARPWPTAPADDPFTAHLNNTRKYVASRSQPKLQWQNSTLLSGDVAAAVVELKQRDGGVIAVLGSGELVRTLIAHDLVDELRLTVHPITLGHGKRLFGEDHQARRLKLVASSTTGGGSLLLSYLPESRAVGPDQG